MNKTVPTIAKQIVDVVSVFHQQSTGHASKAVTVILSEDTLVITLHEALTLAEKALARTAYGATQVQEFCFPPRSKRRGVAKAREGWRGFAAKCKSTMNNSPSVNH